MDVTLRQPHESDWQVIYELAVAAVPWDDNGNQEWVANRRIFTGRRGHYVAEDNGQPVGYGGVDEGPETGVFRMFVVIAAEYFDTVGEALYRQLRADLSDLNARNVWVSEYASDETIQAFFARHGFHEQNRFKLADREDMIVMSRSLRLAVDK